MTDTESARTARKATIGNKRTLLAEVHALDIGGGIEHLLHTRTSLGALVGDHHAVAALHLSTEDTIAGIFL